MVGPYPQEAAFLQDTPSPILLASPSRNAPSLRGDNADVKLRANHASVIYFPQTDQLLAPALTAIYFSPEHLSGRLRVAFFSEQRQEALPMVVILLSRDWWP